MLDSTHTDQPTAEQRKRAIRVVKQHAGDDHDEVELMAMLGLDTEPAPSAPHHNHGALSPAELLDLLAPFAAEHNGSDPLILC